jgi:hypothetical protein
MPVNESFDADYGEASSIARKKSIARRKDGEAEKRAREGEESGPPVCF